MPLSFRRVAVALLMLGGMGVALGDSFAERYVPEREVPDLMQMDPKGEFEDGGTMYCAPVAVSNWMMAMFGDRLEIEGVTQYEVVRKLASVGYMNTHRKHGTHLNQLMTGVQRFVREQGVKDFRVRFQGFHKHERAFSAGMRKPSLNWARGHLSQGAAVWLVVGWYHYDAEKKEYERDGYHWVTLVGYGEDEEGEPDEAMLIVHDSSSSTGSRPAREYVRWSPLGEGTLKGALEDREIGGQGIYRLEGGMHLQRGADVAILEGAVVLSVEEALEEAGPGEADEFPGEE